MSQQHVTMIESQCKARIAELEQKCQEKEKELNDMQKRENEIETTKNEKQNELNIKYEKSLDELSGLKEECKRLREANETESMKTQTARQELDRLLTELDQSRQLVR